MPPWKAVGDLGEFTGDRRLTEDEKRILDRWIAEGCAPGDREQFPLPPVSRESWRTRAPSLVLQPTALGPSPSDGSTMVLASELELSEDAWVTAIEVHPRFAGFQHALLWLDLPPTSEVLEVDDQGQTVRRTLLPIPVWLRDKLLAPAPSALRPKERVAAMAARDRRLLGIWAYDCLSQRFSDGAALPLPAGSRLIVEMPAIRSDSLAAPLEIGLHLASEPPKRMVAIAAVEAVVGGASISREAPRQGAFLVPVDCELQLLAPHAGAACQEVRIGLTLPSGRSESLLWIDRWNPRWETAYQYRRPLQVPARSRLDVQFLSAPMGNTSIEPLHGPALVAAQLIPVQPGDYDELIRAMQRAQMTVARVPVQNARMLR